MSATWAQVPLGEVLSRSERLIPLDPETTYKEVKVRINGKGVVERRLVQGVEIASDRRYEARAGQFIISRIDARHGASGLIPADLDGAVVTKNFPLFDVATDRLDPLFLSWMSKTASFVELCKRESEGTTNRVRLSEERFKGLEIPLPPLDEQRRIVARIEELAAKLDEARGLRSSTANEANHVWARHASELFSSLMPAKPLSLDAVAHIVGGQSLPEIIETPDEPRDVHLIKVSDMNRAGNETYIYSSALSLSANSPLLRGIRLSPKGAVILPKRGGAIATNKKRILTCLAALDPNLMAIFPRDDSELSSTYLFAWLKTIDLASMQDGTSVPQINKGDLAPLPFPLIPTAEQRRIVAELDALQAKADAVKALQTETAAELDAMLPAILDKAFKGEL